MILARVALLVAVLVVAGCAKAPHPSQNPASAIVDPSRVHPVTPEMKRGAGAMEAKAAPAIDIVDPKGKTWTVEALTQNGPALLYFINHECPCCVSAQPFIDRLQKAFEGKVQFAGVVDAEAKLAAEWAKKNEATYPVLPDPARTTIKAYGAKAGVYMTVIDRDGKVVQMLPGYSQKVLANLTESLAELSGSKAPTIDWSDAPKNETTGCEFAP